jgi:mono/diheme cytochrome c family protein
LIFAAVAGCRSEMYDQARYEPYEPASFFADGTSARPILAGTVPWRAGRREGATSSEFFETGMSGGRPAENFPMPVDRALLDRGQERFRIFCTPCHGELGNGKGIVVARGFNPPPTYHSEALRQQPPGHFVDVITRGFGTMYSYAERVPPSDRWAIAAYIKALQLSQNAIARDLPAGDRDRLAPP